MNRPQYLPCSEVLNKFPFIHLICRKMFYSSHDPGLPDVIVAPLHWIFTHSFGKQRNGQKTHTYQLRTRDASVEACFLTTPGGVKPPLGRKVTTADADHCRTLKAIGSAGTAAVRWTDSSGLETG